MLAGLRAAANRLGDRLPKPVLHYALPILGLAALLGIYVVSYYVLRIRLPLYYGFLEILLLIDILGAAWLGYGPGTMMCAVVTLILPRFLRATATRTLTAELSRFVLVLVVSLLVSRISQTRRRTETALRRTAGDAEERLRFVLDAAEIGYWDYDIEKDQTTRSRKYDEIFGYADSPPLWNQQSFLDQVHPDDREMVEAGCLKALNSQSSMEFRIRRADGTIHWVWMQSQGHRDAAGKPVHVSGVIMDTTHRRQTADSLREQAQLLDLAQDAILSTDRSHTISFWSLGAEQMYGWSREEAIGKISDELLHTVFPQPFAEIQCQLEATGYWQGELEHSTRAGERLIVASRWALRRDSRGKPKGYLEINTDITERRRIEGQLRHTQKLESLGVLAGGVAHDFNNLLTGILGNASLVLDDLPAGNPGHQEMQEIVSAAERAADLTRQLLAYAGKGRFVMRTIHLSDLVREIGGLVQASIPKYVQLRLQLTDRLPGIDADPGQLQQIVMNLVINGAEAIPQQGGTVRVQTAVQPVDEQYIQAMGSEGNLLRPGQYVLLEVHDTGSGMTEETLSRIFDPFFTTKFAGRGLGLSAVQGIVRAHYGAIKVYTHPGSGTTFKVLFPASARPVGAQPSVVSKDLAGSGTILVVDDEEGVRQTARRTLERYGYRTLAAGDGAAAVELYRNQPDVIGLVLLDLTMPVMNGDEALRSLQSINPRVRVLLSSGYNESEAVERFSGQGLAGFIQKPYTAAALAEKVKDAMDGKG